MQDNNSDTELQGWIDRIWRDASSHQTFASLVHKVSNPEVHHVLIINDLVITVSFGQLLLPCIY